MYSVRQEEADVALVSLIPLLLLIHADPEDIFCGIGITCLYLFKLRIRNIADGAFGFEIYMCSTLICVFSTCDLSHAEASEHYHRGRTSRQADRQLVSGTEGEI